MTPHNWVETRPKTDYNELGPYLRMYPLPPSQLPAHADLPTDATAMHPDLAIFLKEILDEAYTFATDVIPNKFKVKTENKDSAPSAAKVTLLTHEVKTKTPPVHGKGAAGDLTENWCARISKHENAAKDGTATWEEFDAGLRQDHAVHEKDYTPDLKDANLVLDWKTELASLQDKFGIWRDVHAEIREMVHQLPTPLSKRVFSVLVVSAVRDGEFIDAQLPLDLSGVSKAKYFGASGYTEGIYVSVEYGKLIEDGAKVEWRMATASDAKGMLPMWAQKMGIPGAVAKDVGLFIDWRMKQRKA